MADVVHLPFRPVRGRLLTKKQLAAELGRSTRWIELRMRDDGLPVEPRAKPGEHARFDLAKVRAWMDVQANTRPVSLEERVAMLERTVESLMDRRAS